MLSRYRTAMIVQTTIAVTLLLSACGQKLPDLVQLPAARPAALFIKGVSVLDVESGKLAVNRDVLVQGDKIARIARTGQIEVPAGALEIDGSGATLLPGLIDMHSHLGNASAPRWVGELPNPPRNMQAYLYCGVTTVFDAAGLANKAFKLRDQAASGKLLGPRIYAAGPIFTAKGGHPAAVLGKFAPWWIRWYLIPRYTRQVETPDEARAAVQEIAGLGADAIKLAVDRIPEQVPQLSEEALLAVVAEARS
ncbi:MAG: amidohydrolase family protein, partial [Nevskiales bacterium]